MLASLGLFAVLSYGVAQRRRELSLRAALGADTGRLLLLVVREGFVVSAAGTAIGLGAAALAAQMLRGVLFGIVPLDLPSFATAPPVLLPIAVAASLLPTRRAAASDPAVLLRK